LEAPVYVGETFYEASDSAGQIISLFESELGCILSLRFRQWTTLMFLEGITSPQMTLEHMWKAFCVRTACQRKMQ
jgi:hypothetical protein